MHLRCTLCNDPLTNPHADAVRICTLCRHRTTSADRRAGRLQAPGTMDTA